MPDFEALNDADARLLEEVRRHFARTDPVPPEVLAGAEAAIEFRDIDAQIAELLSDSVVQTPELAGVRGDGPRMLTFAHGDRYVEVEVADGPGGRSLSGYVVPAAAGVLSLEHAQGQADNTIDERGRFANVGPVRGPVRLRIQVAGHAALLTPWLPL